MGRVVYSMSVSLDGFVETPGRSLVWVLVCDDGTSAPRHANRASVASSATPP